MSYIAAVARTERGFSSSTLASPGGSNPLLVALISGGAALAAGYLLFSPSSQPKHSASAAEPTSSATNDDGGPVTASHPAYNFDAAIKELQSFLPEDRLSFEESERETHGHSSWSYHPSHPHAAVVYPIDVSEVVRIVKIAGKHKVPLVPYAGGTSLEAHYSAPDPHSDRRKSISVDFNLMDKILRYSEEDGDITVQPGVRWEGLNEELKNRGSKYFFPIDPGPSAAIGGMVASGCSGTNAVRYGTMKGDYILNLTVVLPSGEVITTRSRARKSSAGPDLTKLFLGSEGTLGLVVAATLRLAPIPPCTSVGVSAFPSASDACSAARDLLAHGIGVQCVELLDDVMLAAVNKANAADTRAIKHVEQPSLFIRFAASSDAAMRADSQLAARILEKHGGSKMQFAMDKDEIERLWHARKVALWSALDYPERKEGEKWRAWTTDVCVPVGQLSELIRRVKDDITQENILSPIVGHIGDGNFHGIILFRDGDQEMFERVERLVHRMVHHAQDLDGTCTGEHGVGIGKKQFLERELGKGTLDLLRMLKRTLDPDSIMNPGKLIDVY
ncbi:hypothetical protein K437DRAFT_258163 [Tilletiaria anomala UBC 951]|uniref:D-lactate dehydrogenase (cytochrome) n=1 Tax=Tilletiaria anomala (strain ATCC 24038 / CBS 436.72 / UBC 951) TaxID=1037660 RepID=A0A066VJK5_TILAU|nr:uncharacterized protein K437DRAFT_258163 [Tilletiaria anomala UBC 951]KDN41676.1 hypothetical protein K437DRAFT_258163 [Tilletiaria anomala UBC 951]